MTSFSEFVPLPSIGSWWRSFASRGRLARKEGSGTEASKRASCRLVDRRDAFQKISQTKTITLGMVAHDLRSPLAAILNRGEFVQTLLRKRQASPELLAKMVESCDIIISLVQRMDRIIGSVLTQAQAEGPVVELNLREFNVSQVVEIAIGLNSRAATSKSISIVGDIVGEVVAMGDEDWVVNALDNLIHNAVKYSHPGQNVAVGVRASAGLVDIFVRDEGQGLTKQDCQRAFHPYQRLSAKPTAGESSTGLGLAIVKAIAEACGGSVRVNSLGKNKGATFSLLLISPRSKCCLRQA